jgi:hypothetical protein
MCFWKSKVMDQIIKMSNSVKLHWYETINKKLNN